jgi:hypothetical protein
VKSEISPFTLHPSPFTLHSSPFTLLTSCGIRSTVRRNSLAPECRAEPALEQKLLGFLAYLKRNSMLLQQSRCDVIQHSAQDEPGRVLPQRLKDHDLIDTIDELRPKAPRKLSPDVGRRLRFGFRTEAQGSMRLMLERDVRGHDEDGIAGIRGSALGVGQPPVVKDLQEQTKSVQSANCKVQTAN